MTYNYINNVEEFDEQILKRKKPGMRKYVYSIWFHLSDIK